MTQPARSTGAPAHFRVDRTMKEDRLSGGYHSHPAGLCLADGRKISKAEAIASLRASRARYYVLADGELAEIQVGERCPRCAEPYLRASNDTSVREALIRLPDC
jgi:proteasome lid subunit RPN8/RPN11